MEWEKLEILRKETTLDLGHGSAGDVRVKEDRKTGVRVIENGLLGMAAARGNVDFDHLLNVAGDSLGLGMKAEFEFPCSGVHEYSDAFPRSDKPAQLYKIGMDLLGTLARPDFQLSGKLKFFNLRTSVTNSRGTELTAEESPWSLALVFKHRDSAGIMDGVISEEGLGMPDLRSVIENAASYFDAFKNEVSLPEVGENIILVPDFMELFGDRFNREVTARNYMAGGTLLSGRLGEHVGKSSLTVRDMPCGMGAGSLPFDHEGILRDPRGVEFISQGRFTRLACDLFDGQRYSLQATGNGYRDIVSNAAVGMKLTIDRGERSVAQICPDHENVIMPVLCAGGGFVDSGAFSTPVQLAFLVKNGKPVGRLPQLSFSTDFMSLLGEGIVEIASHGHSRTSTCPFVFTKGSIDLL